MRPVFQRYYCWPEARRYLHPASLHDRIYAQLLDGIFLALICGLWLYEVSDGELFFLWVSPMIPQFILQVPDYYLPKSQDFWWGGWFFTLDLPYGKSICIQYPVPVFWLIYILYYTLFTFFWGQTPGKVLKKVVVLTERGGPVNGKTALYRWLGYLISLLPLGLGFWWGFFKGKGYTWYDRWTGTRVYSYDPFAREGLDREP